MKDHHDTSSSWFTSVNRILLKYEIQSACTLLSNPVKKLQWKRLVKEIVNTHWRNQVIQQQSRLYDQFYHLSVDGYKPESVHPIVKTQSNIIREVRRISMKVKLTTGTYTVHSIRATFASQPGNGTAYCVKNLKRQSIIFYLNAVSREQSDNTKHRWLFISTKKDIVRFYAWTKSFSAFRRYKFVTVDCRLWSVYHIQYWTSLETVFYTPWRQT